MRNAIAVDSPIAICTANHFWPFICNYSCVHTLDDVGSFVFSSNETAPYSVSIEEWLQGSYH